MEFCYFQDDPSETSSIQKQRIAVNTNTSLRYSCDVTADDHDETVRQTGKQVLFVYEIRLMKILLLQTQSSTETTNYISLH